ncbi:MAG: LamG domain-containing protein, partial [bacterium]|nr:LamG domain-containing protein [bacterium]
WDCIVGKGGAYNLNALTWQYYNGSSWQSLSYTLPANQWVHIVATKQGSNMKVYINGSLSAVKADAYGNITTSTSELNIGYMPEYASSWYFNGKIDSVRIYNRALDEKTIKKHSEISADWQLDEGYGGISYDGSLYANNGTIAGAMWTTDMSRVAIQFDGTDDRVVVPSSATLNAMDGISIEAWVYHTPDSWDCIVGKGGAYNLNALTWQYYNGSSWQSLSYTLPANQWVHIVATKQGSNMKVYINGGNNRGGSTYSKTDAVGNITTSTSELNIGYMPGYASSWYFNGKIDSVRIYNKALADTEVQDKYKEAITAVDWQIDENTGTEVVDILGNANNGIIEGNAAWISGRSQGNYALQFDGTDDKVVVPSSATLNAVPSAADEISIEAWVYHTPDSWDCIVGKGGAYNLNALNWQYYNGSSWQSLSYTLPANQWVHIVATKRGANMKVYLNGSPSASKTDAIGNMNISTSDLNIGHMPGYASSWLFNGKIDSVRIYKKALTGDEVVKLYTNG